MSLELLDRLDMGNPGTGDNTGYLATGNFIGAPAEARGVNLDVAQQGGDNNRVLYYERFDAIYHQVRGRLGNARFLGRLDPLFQTNTGALYGIDADSTISGGFYVDQYDRVGDTQPFYAVATNLNGPVQTVDPLNTQNILVADTFPGYEPDTNGLAAGTLGRFNNQGGSVVFFRGLAASGIALHCRGLANIDGITDVGNQTFTVDLATDLAAEILWPAVETIFGSSVTWTYIQFLQDEDSTLTNPKGEIIQFASGLPNTPVSGTHRFYIQRRDWNPNGVGGIPSRQHTRRTLITAYEVIGGACPAQPNGVPALGGVLQPLNAGVFVPSTRQYLAGYSDGTQSTVYASCESVAMRFSESAAVDVITDPAMVGDVTSNKTVRFRQEVRGTLSEPIGGVALAYSLDRRSTKGEILAVTPAPGETVPVANAPINAVGTVNVREDAALLVDGVDYTVTRDPGGAINFIAPKPLAGPVYTVDYPHFATGAVPPNGSLLDGTAVSDITGTSEVRVKYADAAAIVNEFDGLEGVPL